jgi:hypothetical protein
LFAPFEEQADPLIDTFEELKLTQLLREYECFEDFLIVVSEELKS